MLQLMLDTAAWAARGDLVDRLLAAGAQISTRTVIDQLPISRWALYDSHSIPSMDLREAAAAVCLLLERHVPPVSLEGGGLIDNCPIYALLSDFKNELHSVKERAFRVRCWKKRARPHWGPDTPPCPAGVSS
jgi:hypothetical protein